MHTPTTGGAEPGETPEAAAGALYAALLDAWNRRDAADLASLFTADGNLIGFDGSAVDGSAAIAAHLAPIFTDHPTGAYVGKVRDVRVLSPDVALLRAVAGMVPPGGVDVNPQVNAIQSLLAVRLDAGWRIALYQNTPAAFHGRPHLQAALTAELRALLPARGLAL
ncbi:MAG TPA: SgcJ/EcaC family oxidoreductase [Chloroflexia bacterium]|nr:SgcJ/EcaC family oxidoreductase [Chloroflexia bacterium]